MPVRRVQKSLAALTLIVAVAVPVARLEGRAARAGADTIAAARAIRFLNDANRGRFILQFLHFGTEYRGHPLVTMRDGSVVRELSGGAFAVFYDFAWDADGRTIVGFVFDRAGRLRDLEVVDTNAVLAQPFRMANAAIGVVGAVGLDAMREDLTRSELALARELISAADAKRLLVLLLALQQAA